MDISKIVRDLLIRAFKMAKDNKNEFITAEHILLSALEEDKFKNAIEKLNGNVKELKDDLIYYIDNLVTKYEFYGIEPEESQAVKNIFLVATQQATLSNKNLVELQHMIFALFSLKDSYAVYYLLKQGIDKTNLVYELAHDKSEEKEVIKDFIKIIKVKQTPNDKSNEEDKKIKDNNKLLIDLIDNISEENLLIGREDIIDRTIQVLSRKTKNNPIHLGEPGVGKTAITMGIARLIKEGRVPDKLKNAKILSLDIGSLVAGTKYRGDFEERIKNVFEEIKKYENPIVYIDEIHNIVGSGSLNGGSLDGANLIKSYLLEGKIKVIGSTTYDDYKKHFEKDKALVRRFQIIEVNETSVEDTINIIKGIIKTYEDYHKVKYLDEAIELAVTLSDKYIKDRFLPDKAIDIIDEAGAYVDINNLDKIVNKEIIEDIVSKICKIPKTKVENKESDNLKNLENELKKNVFGQDKAIEDITKAIKFSRAGLSKAEKPIASMLFIGPTGVGKTEIAKVLAKTLDISLIRFDMSEYGEKHSVAKLIGSPPGYVGYEEGGLLIDSIRKNPNSVLLLDEIEKAHPDILNVLLQVMDYATITDNKGRKADLRNTIIIMTSNAGVTNINKKSVGFMKEYNDNTPMNEEIKKIFSPEFRNRLDNIVIFNELSEAVSKEIVKKELKIFSETLAAKNINISFSKDVISMISKEAISKEYGAREITRFINSNIKVMLVDEILFGRLKNGGNCRVKLTNEKIKLVVKR